MLNSIFTFVSKALSYTFHPILMPVLIFGTLAMFDVGLLTPYNEENIVYFIAFIFIFTWFVPALGILGLYYGKVINSLHLDSVTDRIYSIIITTAIYTFTIYFLYFKLRANEKVVTIMVSIVVTQLIAGIITFFWKISLHSTAAWGLVCCLLLLNKLYCIDDNLFMPIVFFTFLSGCLMSARLYLQKHTIGQIAAGVGLSSFVMVLTGIYLSL